MTDQQEKEFFRLHTKVNSYLLVCILSVLLAMLLGLHFGINKIAAELERGREQIRKIEETFQPYFPR